MMQSNPRKQFDKIYLRVNTQTNEIEIPREKH